MHLLSVHRAIDSVQYLLFYLYRFLFPLMLSVLLYLYHSTLLLLNDLHTSWIESYFYICLCTQLHIHLLWFIQRSRVTYSKLLYPLLNSKASKHKLANSLTDWLTNPCTHWNSLSISFLQTRYIPIHACYKLNHDLIPTLTDSTTLIISVDLLSSSHRLSFLF